MRDPNDPWADELAARRATRPTTGPDPVTACNLCDDDGYRGSSICDHIDHAPAARRGIQACRQALQRKNES